jgi:hypothetical protein
VSPEKEGPEVKYPETVEAVEYRQSEKLSVMEKHFSIERHLISRKLIEIQTFCSM